MKKFILKLELIDDREKRKALKTVSALSGIDEISMDMKGKKLTVIGTVDPVSVVSRLRKYWPTDIISVGPAKEPEKKEEPKKEEPKKEEGKIEETKAEEPKKDEAKKEEPKKDEAKKEDNKKPEPAPAPAPTPVPAPPFPHGAPAPPFLPVVGTTVMPYRPYYPPVNTYYYAHQSMEENPNACVIC